MHLLAEQDTRTRKDAPGALRAVGVAWLGMLLVGMFVALWPVSYDLTQGSDFSYEYLLQYAPVWEWFRPIFLRFEALFPTAATSLEQLTTMLTIFWIASFAIYFSAFLLMRAVPQRWWTVLLVVAPVPVFQAILFFMPGTFTTDLFSYVMYGMIPRVYDLNPYIYVPGYFPGNRMTSWIHPVWYYTPAIYGPVWIDLSVWLTGFIRDRSLVDQALAYRLVSNVAQLANLALVGLLLRKLAPPLPVSLLLLFAWNPLLLVEFAASGHNDSLMLTFLLLACLLFVYRQHLLSVVAISLGTLIKVTPILVLPLLLIHWAGFQRTLVSRLRILVLGSLVFLTIAVALYAPWYSGPDTFLLIDYWSKGPMYLNYVPDLLAGTIADQILDPTLVNQAASWETARTTVKWVTRVVFVVYFAWELLRLKRPIDLLAAMSRVFLVFLLLVNTWVLPWYITWPFILAVPLGWERVQTRVATGFTLSAPVMMYNHHYWSEHMPPWLYLVYLAPLLLLLQPLRRKSGARTTRGRQAVPPTASPLAVSRADS